MIFASIESKEIPFRAGQRVSVFPQEGSTMVVRDTQPAHPANPILADFRQSDRSLSAWLDALETFTAEPAGTGRRIEPEHVAHAKRVLTRLANWKEQ